MDDIVITYLLYAVSLILVVSLLSFSIINYKAGAKTVENSSYDLEAAREDYKIGAYTGEGYYISGKLVEDLKSNGKAVILYDDDKEYRWVYKHTDLNGYTQLNLNSCIDINDTKIIKIDESIQGTINNDEVYKLSTYTVSLGGSQALIYIIE